MARLARFIPRPWLKAATPREFARAKQDGVSVVVPEDRKFSAWYYNGNIYLEGKR